MVKRTLVTTSWFALWVLSACYSGEPLKALQASPNGALDHSPAWLEVRFDKPIVDPYAAETKATGLTLTVTPKVEGKLEFPTPSSVVYTFTAPVPPAQTYNVEVAAGLRSADGKSVLKNAYKFSFTTDRNKATMFRRVSHPEAEGAFPVDTDGRVTNLALNDQLHVTLRYPEATPKLKSLISVVGEPMAGGPAVPLKVKLAFPSDTAADRFLVQPDGEWPKHTNLKIKIGKGLGITAVPAGPLVSAEESVLTAATYGPIDIVKGPECDGCRPPPTMMFEFSTPVDCADVLSKVTLKPKVDDLKCAGQPQPTMVRIEPVPSLAAYTDYTITVNPGVVDRFKQELKVTKKFKLKTGDAHPRFAHQLMFNVLERALGTAHQEKVYKTPKLKVEGARLPFAEAWKVIAAEELQGQVAWSQLPWWLSDDYYYFYDCEWNDEEQREICGQQNRARRYPGEPDNPDFAIPNAVTKEMDVDATGWTVVDIPLDPFLQKQGGIVVLKSTPFDKSGNKLSDPVLRLLNVTNIGLSAKYSPSQLIVLAAGLADGKSLKDLKIDVYAVAPKAGGILGPPIASATTDAEGIATFTAAQVTPPGQEANLQARGLLITATSSDDQAFIWSNFESGGRRAPKEGPQLVGSVYTERGVYRPGETVFYRVVARKQVAGGFATPSGAVKVVARYGYYWRGGDSEDEVYKKDDTFSTYGTLSGSFVVPAEARVGDYAIAVDVDGQSIQASFKVAEFRRAEMKVSVNTDKEEYTRGDELKARVNADFLFGAPAAGLTMRWSLRRQWASFDSERFPQAEFSDYDYHSWGDEERSYSEFVDEATVTLDQEGSFAFERKLDTAGSYGKLENLILSATVDDTSGQSVSARKSVRVHPADFHVGIIPHGYLKDKDKVFTFEAVAVNAKDEAYAGAAVKVSMYQEYWYSVKRKGPGGRLYWDYKKEIFQEQNVCSGKTDNRGLLTCQFTPRKGGSVRLRVEAKDAKGREVRASSWFWITGDPDYYGGRSEGANQVGLMTEAPQLEVGEKAKIAITSPFKDALALVTVEREEILWRKVIPVGTSATVEIPVANTWAPNVFVSATIVRGRVTPEGDMEADPERDKPAFALGYLNLKVRPTKNILSVKTASDKPIYEPGQEVTATVTVKDHGGAPVQSEVNLYAVDEGVLMLTSYKTPDLIPALFRERGHYVLALDTRMHVLGRRQFITPVIKGEEDGGGGGNGADQGEELRKDFNPVATWVGSLVTDATGSATHKFKIPDTLTTYRLMAVAVTDSDRFGSGDSQFKVQKTLMMRQAMPRFARPGDKMQAGVVVNQLSGKDDEVTVSIEKIDESLFKVSGKKSLVKKVGAKETAQFRFDLEAADAEGASEIIFAAKMGKYKDRVQLVLPVKRLQPRESRSVAGVLEPGTVTHTLELPQGARPTELELNMSGLPVASLEEKVRALVGYPYGCLEQRTSKIMPLIAIRELSDKLGFKSVNSDQIKKWVEEWVTLVPKYRCKDDGFDYYPGCAYGSNPYLTTFALEGLLTAKKYGYTVPDSVIDPPAKYLENQLAKMEGKGSSWDHNSSGLASALRVLAAINRSKPAYESRLFESRASLPLFAKTDLARAIYSRTKTKGNMVNALLTDVMKGGVTTTAGVLKFKADDSDRYWWAWDSDLRSTALVLRTLLEVEPADSRIPLIVRGLIDLDSAESYYTTQGVTQTLLALAEAAEQITTMNKKPIVTLKIGDKVIVADKSIGASIERATLTGADLAKSPYNLAFSNKGTGPLFFGAFLHYAFPATARLPAKSEGFKVTRTFTDKAGKPVGDEVTVGDYIQVNLELLVEEDGRMVVIDDPMPAGLEPVDTTLDTSDTEMAAVMEHRGGDWSWWRSQYREIRDDRVEWHFHQLWRTRWSAKEKEYPIKLNYLTRAVTPGTYYAPGTSVERMYQPHIRGRGEGKALVIKPKP